MASDPINFLLAARKKHPDIFKMQRKNGFGYVCLAEPSLFELVLTDGAFGSVLQAENMQVSHMVFGIPKEVLSLWIERKTQITPFAKQTG